MASKATTLEQQRHLASISEQKEVATDYLTLPGADEKADVMSKASEDQQQFHTAVEEYISNVNVKRNQLPSLFNDILIQGTAGETSPMG